MGGVLTVKLGPIFAWQLLVLAALVVGVGSVAYVGVMAATGSNAGKLGENEQLVPAQIGSLSNIVSTDGTLSFPNIETASFSVAGTVGAVLVAAGDTVEEGDALATLSDTTLADLRAKVATARTNRTKAQTAVDEASSPPTQLAVAQQNSAVAKANQAVNTAQKALDALLNTGAAEDAVEAAQAALASAQVTLVTTTDTWNTNIANAEKALDDALAKYVDTYFNWLGVARSAINPDVGPATNLTNLDIDLSIVYGSNEGYINYALLTTPPDDPATSWNETTVFWYKTFYPGSIVGTCSGSAPKQGICVRLAMDEAWTALQAARTALATAKSQAAANVSNATTQVSSAQVTLSGAEELLAGLLTSVDTDEIVILRANLAVAEANLETAQDTLAELLNGPSQDDLDVLLAQLATAESALAAAEEDLTNATLIAPLSGVVTDVNLTVGGNATGQGLGITVVDQSVVEITGRLDEVDVLSISEGDVAVISLTALAGQTLRGQITEIGAASNSQGVVTFPVAFEVEVPQGLQLREGLSATASIVVSQVNDVLRVPTSAVQGSFFAPVVRVSDNGKITERPVELGASDDFWVVVASGLEEGEQVVMPAPSASSTQQFANFTVGGTGFSIDQGQILRQIQGAGQQGGNFQGGRGQNGTVQRPNAAPGN